MFLVERRDDASSRASELGLRGAAARAADDAQQRWMGSPDGG
jgi:hypothetical protein